MVVVAGADKGRVGVLAGLEDEAGEVLEFVPGRGGSSDGHCDLAVVALARRVQLLQEEVLAVS